MINIDYIVIALFDLISFLKFKFFCKHFNADEARKRFNQVKIKNKEIEDKNDKQNKKRLNREVSFVSYIVYVGIKESVNKLSDIYVFNFDRYCLVNSFEDIAIKIKEEFVNRGFEVHIHENVRSIVFMW